MTLPLTMSLWGAAGGFLAAVSTLSKNTCAAAIQQTPYRIQRIGMPQQLNHFVRYISWFEYLRGRMA